MGFWLTVVAVYIGVLAACATAVVALFLWNELTRPPDFVDDRESRP